MDLTKFSGPIRLLMPLDNPRDMIVLDEAWYKDPDGKIWRVPVGARINGVSIPRLLWPLVGSPYVGLARGPAVFHDHHCGLRAAPYMAVHQMFLDALLDVGVPSPQALLMYQAVAEFGPRWDEHGQPLTSPRLDDQGAPWGLDYDLIGT